MTQISGMSDLHMYELEDIVWDELGQIGDHIVPHPNNEHEDEPAYEEDNFKKLRNEVIGVSNNAGHSFGTTYANQEEEGSIQHQKKRRTKSSEKELWPHLTEDIIPDSRDSGFSRESTKVSFDCVRVPGQHLMSSYVDTIDAEFCGNDTIAGEGCAANDTNFCAYSLDDISQTENDLSFLDNDREDNGSASADLLYYGWPDIENFEDVDRMFRSCDSTFGFGSSNEDNLAWLSSSHNIEQHEGILKSDFSPLKNIPEQDLSKLNNASSSANDSNTGISYISYKSGFQGSGSGAADPIGSMGSMNGSVISDREGKLTPKEQQNIQFGSDIHFNNSTAYRSTDGNGQRKKQATRPNLSEGKRKDRHKSCQVFAHPDYEKEKKNVAPNAFGYLQTPTPYMHLNYIYPSDPISVGSQLSSIKSEINSLTSGSPMESSHASNQARSMESSHCHPFGAPVMSVDDKLEKLRRRKGFYHSPVSKQVGLSQNEGENHSGFERGNVANPAEVDSSNVPETSCISSGFDEISLEASSFRQLQQVMEQLDIRTKFCIRDSLYRLARSAEQRHRYANMKGGGQSRGEAGDAFMADGSNNGFVDMETDTNPIDRSVAHLLFHRPSDLSTMPAHDGSSLKPHTLELNGQIHQSIASPPVMVEQLVCREEVATEAEKKVSLTDDSK